MCWHLKKQFWEKERDGEDDVHVFFYDSINIWVLITNLSMSSIMYKRRESGYF